MIESAIFHYYHENMIDLAHQIAGCPGIAQTRWGDLPSSRANLSHRAADDPCIKRVGFRVRFNGGHVVNRDGVVVHAKRIQGDGSAQYLRHDERSLKDRLFDDRTKCVHEEVIRNMFSKIVRKTYLSETEQSYCKDVREQRSFPGDGYIERIVVHPRNGRNVT